MEFEKACEDGDFEKVKALFTNSIPFDERNKCLQLASEGGHLEVVKFLVENGADVTANNQAILKASCHGTS